MIASASKALPEADAMHAEHPPRRSLLEAVGLIEEHALCAIGFEVDRREPGLISLFAEALELTKQKPARAPALPDRVDAQDGQVPMGLQWSDLPQLDVYTAPELHCTQPLIPKAPELTKNPRRWNRSGAGGNRDEPAHDPSTRAQDATKHSAAPFMRVGGVDRVEHEGSKTGAIGAETTTGRWTVDLPVHRIVAKGAGQHLEHRPPLRQIGCGDRCIGHFHLRSPPGLCMPWGSQDTGSIFSDMGMFSGMGKQAA